MRTDDDEDRDDLAEESEVRLVVQLIVDIVLLTDLQDNKTVSNLNYFQKS